MKLQRFIAIIFMLCVLDCKASLSGEWQSDCTKLIKRHSVTSNITFSDDSLFAVQKLYADQQCQTLNLEIYYETKFEASESEFLWRPLKIELVVFNPDVVIYYNSKNICGFNNWELNVPRDIAGRLCRPNYMPSATKTYADKFLIKTPEVIQLTRFPDIPKNTGIV